jgi:hypothetical protein
MQNLLADPQFHNLRKLGAAGGTVMAPALKHVLDIAAQKSAGRQRNLILITDAQVGNETAILELMKTAPDMAVHCFGIDIALNDALLLALARQQGGTFHSLNPNDDIPALVTKLGKTLRQPVLLELRLPAGWETAEAKIPNLYSGQILYLSAKAAGVLPLELTARTPAGELWRLNFQSQPSSQEAPYLHWCKTRIQRLLAESQETEAIALSVASNLLCRLTAFIAWDEAEKVAVSRHELIQPAMLLGSETAAGAPAGLRAASYGSELQMFTKKISRPWGATDHVTPAQKIVPHDLLAQLSVSCQKINGHEWHPHYLAISQWFSQAPSEEVAKIGAELQRLARQLNSLVHLLAALNAGGSRLVMQLNHWWLQFRMLLEQENAYIDLKEHDALYREVKHINAATPPEALATLSSKIQRQAVETLKRFADNLPVRK